MERILDKAMVLILCLGLVILTGVTPLAVTGLLVAVCLTAAFELSSLPVHLRKALPLVYCLLAAFIPGFIAFLPIAAGDLLRVKPAWLRVVWVIPLILTLALSEYIPEDSLLIGGAAALCLMSCYLSWRAQQVLREQALARTERDVLAQLTNNLELNNRDLRDRQELELKIATLNERSRIAREIHDNVGHLLTRSVLQVKALMVVHAQDAELTEELEQVSTTLDTAFEAVRTSVHDLHEEAHSLQTQLEAIVQETESLEIKIEYRAEEVPSPIAYAFLGIVREALSNTRRHSDATAVDVSVVEFPGLFQLVVHDNGSSLPSSSNPAQSGGIGLSTMEERARSLGGIFRVSYDKGFKVFVSIPKGGAK